MVLDELGYVLSTKGGVALIFDLFVIAFEHSSITVMTN